MRFRKKPVVIDAICPWRGDEADMIALDSFCNHAWTRADAVDQPAVDSAGVVILNSKEKQWINLPIGHWVIRGIDGEYYPCDPSVFERTYEPVEAPC